MDLVSLGLLYAWAMVGLVIGDKCADECSCKWKGGKRTVECVNRDLTGIPEWIDPETQVLDASGNPIKSLPSNIFVRVRLTNLQRLYLRECRIDRIDKEALTGLTNLVELDLSKNLLTSVPKASFANTPFLRDLTLSRNPIAKVKAGDFDDTPNLVKLDLSAARMIEIEAKGFRGLDSLESLRLNDNRLSTLHPGTFDPLNKLTSIELHDNPWICDCHLREMKMWLVKHNLPSLVPPVCHAPEQLSKRTFADLGIDDFACRPVLMIASRYAEATIGENASIVCRVSAIPPAKVKWYWNGRLLTNHSAFSSYQKIIIYEEGQFRKRSTLVLTNAQEADSSEFYCVAENKAGSVEANFTLHVSLRTAGMSTLGSGQIAGISAALVVLILLILLVILVLFVRLRRMRPIKDVKSPAPPSTSESESRAATVNSTNASSSVCTAGTTTTTTTAAFTATTRRKRGISEQQPEVRSGSPIVAVVAAHPVTGSSGTLSRTGTLSGSTVAASAFNYVGVDDSRHPVSLNLNYLQRTQQQVVPQEGQCGLDDQLLAGTTGTRAALLLPSGGFSSTTSSSLMAIDNPDLIRDTRRGSPEDPTTAYGGVREEECANSKILYSSCVWEATRDTGRTISVAVSRYPSKEVLPIVGGPPAPIPQDHFPPGAKQLRIWQKGVPVLPPVSALKRVLGSTRSSPDEGYQEGTGTDV
ncbi:leucine-rich repeat-containing protein 24 [Prorops nasuta]|uniref:leucine-rich repeat-containing protein 24 n=1 Tax=Prorops nasuta TaxID=863751 RepID=UPI0034CF6B97